MAAQHRAQLGAQVVAAEDAVGQVGPVERADQHLRPAQAQLLDDVAPHPLGGGGGEGVQRGLREALAQRAEQPVLGPEGVPPLADAVRLVDREVAHRRPLEQAEEPLGPLAGEPLRRHVEQTQTAGQGVGAHPVALRRPQGGVVVGGGDAVGAQRVDLVLHQRDERRDHHRQPAVEQRRRLVAERLAAAGGQHHQAVAAAADRLERLELERQQPLEAPDPAHQLADLGRLTAAGCRDRDLLLHRLVASGASLPAAPPGWTSGAMAHAMRDANAGVASCRAGTRRAARGRAPGAR